MQLGKNKYFAFSVLPLFIAGQILILFQKTDVGGAKRDATVGHLPLIRYIANHHNLPLPGDYRVANIPLWHFLAAILYGVTNSSIVIAAFQLSIAVSTLLIMQSLLRQYVSSLITNLLVSAVAINSYFISSSHFPTTDGLSMFSFTLFFYALNKLMTEPKRIKYVALANFSLAFSALNRQMFIILFAVYAITFLRKKPIPRIFIEILPSVTVVLVGFYLFYVKYCNFLKSDVCWPVRQSKDLVFPIFVNLPIVSLLIAIFVFPLFASQTLFETNTMKLILMATVGTMSLMHLYGSKKINSEKNITGGGLYKFRELFGSFSIFFDVIAICSLLLIIFLVFRNNQLNSWAFQGILVFVLSSLFGPYAFQRYFETYLLILCAIFLAMNSEQIFAKSKFTLKYWAVVLILFQASELIASVFIPV